MLYRQGRLLHTTQTIKGCVYDLWYEYGSFDRVAKLPLKDGQGRVLAQLGFTYAPSKTAVSALVGGVIKEFGQVY